MTTLAGDAAVEAVVFGDGGLLAAGSDLLHVSCSTVSVDRQAGGGARRGGAAVRVGAGIGTPGRRGGHLDTMEYA
jgi:3-hydroxyisobutyrate dehydrogenase-like beta-hydroxyacid dehydrogenase